MKRSKHNVTIRDTEPRDIELLVAWWQDGSIMAHAGFPNGLQTNKDRLLEDVLLQQQPNYNKTFRLIIEYGSYRIGEMSYRVIDSKTYEIGIKICDKQERNKGIGSIAIELLLEYIFDTQKGSTVILDTNKNNISAQKFYERLGFIKTGERVDCFTDQLGVSQSAVDYVMTKEMYQSKKAQ